MPPFTTVAVRLTLLTATVAAALFPILVQGTTLPRLARRVIPAGV